MQRILVVDDDTELCELVGEYVRAEGFGLEAVHDGGAGLEAAFAGDHAMVLLDVMLPGISGFEVLRRLRTTSQIPVLMLTARGDDVDRIVGLEMGADDYLSKPFNPRELVARVRAILRRVRQTGELPAEPRVLTFGSLEIDLGAREARVDGVARRLTSHQFALLEALASRAGRVMTRDQLMQAVRAEPLDAFDRSIDVHVSRIRAAIEDDPKDPKRILTVRGMGYIFTERSGEAS